jgi:hypothetical protein
MAATGRSLDWQFGGSAGFSYAAAVGAEGGGKGTCRRAYNLTEAPCP